jgi:hypothetical protein
MLERLRGAYPHWRLIFVWDHVSYHRAKAVRARAQELGIELVFLSYSPDLQPAERLWAWLREEVTALHCHRDVEQLCARIAWFEQDTNAHPPPSTNASAPNSTSTPRRKNCGGDSGRGLGRARRPPDYWIHL